MCQAINPVSAGTFCSEPGFVPRQGGIQLDSFHRLEALIDSAGVDDVKEANALLRRFKGGSQDVTAAIDEFMLDFVTLVFVVEVGQDDFERPIRKLARTSLSTLNHLVNVAA